MILKFRGKTKISPYSQRKRKIIKFVKINKYPKRTKAEWRTIINQPFGDADGDRVLNWFDCRPLDKHKKEYGEFILDRLEQQRLERNAIRAEKKRNLRERRRGGRPKKVNLPKIHTDEGERRITEEEYNEILAMKPEDLDD